MLKIYVAGPIGKRDEQRAGKIDRALEVGSQLLMLGYAPFIPHFWHFAEERGLSGGYEQMLAYDFTWLGACDGVLRLDGESPGADREVARARQLGLPVFHSIVEVAEAWGDPS